MTKIQPYRPLPRKLYIDSSPIEGNGLFTSSDIPKDNELGITHIKNDSGDFHSDFIRTPLGGFVNHSENSNCMLFECGNYLKMKTTKTIKEGEELTLSYSLYEPCKNYL